MKFSFISFKRILINFQSCIVVNQNKTLNHQHDFCNSDLCSDKLYQSIKKENIFLVDETLDIHIAAQFDHFEHPNDKTSKKGENKTSAKRKYDSNFVFEPKANPEEVQNICAVIAQKTFQQKPASKFTSNSIMIL